MKKRQLKVLDVGQLKMSDNLLLLKTLYRWCFPRVNHSVL